MKKSLIALAVLAASGAAMAQSSVTLKGNVAFAYEQTNSGDAQITTHDTGANNFTFTGTEDLGGGLKLGFSLQSRFNLDTGANANNGSGVFEDTVVSLTGGFGTVKVGRFQAFSNARFDAFLGYGTGTTGYTIYGYNSHTNLRKDKSIAYDSPNMGGFNIGVVTTINSANVENEYTVVRAMYVNGPLDVQISWEKNESTTLGTSGRNDYSVGGSYDFKVAKVMFSHGKDGGTKSDTSVGVTAPFGNAVLKAQYRTERVSSNASGKTVAIGVDYNLSKRTALFADMSNVDGATQQGYRLGLRHSF